MRLVKFDRFIRKLPSKHKPISNPIPTLTQNQGNLIGTIVNANLVNVSFLVPLVLIERL